MSWAELPAEILYAIFETFNDVRSANESQRVCKKWSVPAQHVLYEKLWFIDESKKRLTNFLNCLLAHPTSRGQLVKAIHFGFSCNQRQYENIDRELMEFAKLCPHVEHVKAFNPLPAFYEVIKRASLFYWKCLKSIPRPSMSSFEPIDYIVCTFQLKSSLQEISISRNFLADRFSRDFLTQLNEFPFLNKLNIMDTLKPGHLDDLLELVPRTSALSLISVDDLDGFDYTLSSAVPCPQIKSIESVSLVFEKNILNYFMDKFPALEYLEMDLSVSILCSQTDFHRNPSRLMEYIRNIPKYNVRIVFPTLDCVYSILELLNPTTLDVVLYSEKVEVTQKDSAGSKMTLVYTTSSSVMGVRNSLGKDTAMISSTHVKDMPIVPILEHCGWGLEQLNLDNRALYDYREPLMDVIRLCPKLKKLLYSTRILSKLSSYNVKSMETSSIESLSIVTTHRSQSTFLQLSHSLPSLRWLKASIGPFTNYSSNERFTLDMPSTAFDYLYLSIHQTWLIKEESQQPIILKVVTKHIDKFYKIDRNGIEECPHQYISPDITIQCQSLKKLSLILGPRFYNKIINC